MHQHFFFFFNFSVSCVRRQANNVTHFLTKEALSIVNLSCLFYHVPLCIEILIINEMH